jgi:hypothetical protein
VATQLKNIVRFVNVAIGVPTSLPHSLNIDGRSVVPDFVGAVGDFTVTANATNVTVTNNGNAPADLDVIVEHWHTIERAFGAASTTVLVPQPFVLRAGAGGSDDQRFRYTATGAEGSDFMVTLPVAQGTDDYIIVASLSDAPAIYGMRFPNALAGDRTTTQFRVITTAALTAGDVIEFRVVDPS